MSGLTPPADQDFSVGFRLNKSFGKILKLGILDVKTNR